MARQRFAIVLGLGMLAVAAVVLTASLPPPPEIVSYVTSFDFSIPFIVLTTAVGVALLEIALFGRSSSVLAFIVLGFQVARSFIRRSLDPLSEVSLSGRGSVGATYI